jgi:Ca-activated chloride channel family protein
MKHLSFDQGARMKFRPLSIITILSLLLSACGALGNVIPRASVTVSIVYGSEKQAWIEPLIQQFNDAQNQTSGGKTIVVAGTAMGSIESVRGILDGTLQPTVWSPASSVYIPVANSEWNKSHADDLVTGTPKDLVLSPVVIAMWRPMAQALGWPDKALGWEDIAQLAISEEGWSAYGHPNGDRSSLGTHIPRIATAASFRSSPRRMQAWANSAA